MGGASDASSIGMASSSCTGRETGAELLEVELRPQLLRSRRVGCISRRPTYSEAPMPHAKAPNRVLNAP